jgi:phosphatidylglycerol lysyltransferase
MIKEKTATVRNYLKDKVFIFLSENARIITQFLFTTLFMVLAAWFIFHQKHELNTVRLVIADANKYWIMTGLGLVLFYIFIQGVMYVTSFASINVRLKLWDAIILFLKRNFVSVFLPAGAVSSLAFFSNEIERKGITKTQVYISSSIYAFVGILSVVIVAIPAFLFVVSGGNIGEGKWYALAGVVSILFLFVYVYYSFLKKGKLYDWVIKIYPKAEIFIEEVKNNKINRKQFLFTVLVSVLIEFVGIAHVYISMLALNFPASVSTSIIAYIVVVIFLIISPFLRGLGAIEVSMTYVLLHSGFNNIEAV